MTGSEGIINSHFFEFIQVMFTGEKYKMNKRKILINDAVEDISIVLNSLWYCQ